MTALDYGVPTSPPRLRWIPRWLSGSALAVADQGLFSISSFILNLLLAHWLIEEDYGGFATAFAIFLGVGALHHAFFIEPLLILGSSQYRSRFTQYLGALTWGTTIFGAAAALFLGAASGIAWLCGATPLAIALLGMAIAAPFVLFLWLSRRYSYVRLDPAAATVAGALYLVLMAAGLFALEETGLLSVLSACCVVAFASLVCGLWLTIRERTQRIALTSDLAREVRHEHWRYGRWSAPTAMVGFITMHVYYLILPGFAGLEASGAQRALMNLVMPIIQANTAMGTLLSARLASSRGTSTYGRSVRWALLLLGGPALLYWLMLGLFHRQAMELVYHGKFIEYAPLLWVFGLHPIFTGLSSIFHAVLSSRRRPDLAFFASAAAAAVGTTGAFLTASRYGVAGMAWSGLAALVVFFTLTLIFSRRLGPEPTASAAGQASSAGPEHGTLSAPASDRTEPAHPSQSEPMTGTSTGA